MGATAEDLLLGDEDATLGQGERTPRQRAHDHPNRTVASVRPRRVEAAVGEQAGEALGLGARAGGNQHVEAVLPPEPNSLCQGLERTVLALTMPRLPARLLEVRVVADGEGGRVGSHELELIERPGTRAAGDAGAVRDQSHPSAELLGYLGLADVEGGNRIVGETLARSFALPGAFELVSHGREHARTVLAHDGCAFAEVVPERPELVEGRQVGFGAEEGGPVGHVLGQEARLGGRQVDRVAERAHRLACPFRPGWRGDGLAGWAQPDPPELAERSLVVRVEPAEAQDEVTIELDPHGQRLRRRPHVEQAAPHGQASRILDHRHAEVAGSRELGDHAVEVELLVGLDEHGGLGERPGRQRAPHQRSRRHHHQAVIEADAELEQGCDTMHGGATVRMHLAVADWCPAPGSRVDRVDRRAEPRAVTDRSARERGVRNRPRCVAPSPYLR